MATILIIGGTGTLGKALIKRLQNDNILRIYSRDEFKQYELRHEKNCKFFIGDVRDKKRLEMAMENVDIVIHAAAMKNIEISEYNPFEAIKTNVYGTQNVIDCAMKTRPKQVLFVSTDKAVSPENLYGATKLCAERLIISANNYKGPRDTMFKFVRYGNVWGSRGSVLHQWATQDKIKVRDMSSTRFHLMPEDAVDIIMDALASDKVKNIPKPKAYELKALAITYSNMTGKEIEEVDKLTGEKSHESLDIGVTSHGADKLSGDELRKLVSDFLNQE
jgi:FlaA1/EpsC-like NDP-sugar epimerase